MLDVHPPHHAATTWRDFFIHIATIVLGLLIAIGLEQTVERIHHRHQAREARVQLFEEMRKNEKNVKEYARELDKTLLRLHEEMDAVARARVHESRPDDSIVTMQGYYSIGDSAWTTVHGSNAVEYMDQREVADWAQLYDLQTELNLESHDALALEAKFAPVIAANKQPALTTAQVGEIEGGPLKVDDVIRTLSAQKHLDALTPVQLDSAQAALEQSIVANQRLQRNAAWLDIEYTRFEREHAAR
jgi:uncharacterized protein YukE